MSVHADIGSDRFGRYTDLVYADLVMTFQRDASGNFLVLVRCSLN